MPLTLVSCAAVLFACTLTGLGFASPIRALRRIPNAAVSGRPAASALAAVATAEAETAIDERILGAWRYSHGAYEIRERSGRLYFDEHVSGELKPEGEWLVAELPTAGTIRLKLTDAGEIQSNFKQLGTEVWGDTITAVKEWETLSAKTKELHEHLRTLEFEGSTADGGVVVAVDGHQRPTNLKISPEAAKSSELGSWIVDAQSKAAEVSHGVMTEKLRELYASHFRQTPPEAA